MTDTPPEPIVLRRSTTVEQYGLHLEEEECSSRAYGPELTYTHTHCTFADL